MLRFSSIPLFFLAVAACIGLLLRFHSISPVSGFVYPYWLHAHSHLMFLGWITNVLYIAFVTQYVPNAGKRYRILFIVIQLMITGMLISFPLQGYGVVSITLTTLHTFGICLFTWWIYQDTHSLGFSISLSFAKRALFFFMASALGPFSLGALTANGMSHTEWYYSAIYFYLHFQYNGVFIFGCLSLFYYLLEQRNIPFDLQHAKIAGSLLFIACFPAYALSVLWTSPAFVVNVIGGVGALLQIASAFHLWKSLRPAIHIVLRDCTNPGKVLLVIVVASYGVKLLLQLLSAIPTIALLAYETHSYIIAYLHLVLIGIITFSLLFWFLQTITHNATQSVNNRYWYALCTLIAGFIGLELTLLCGESLLHNSVFYLFGFSLLLTIGFCMIFVIHLKRSY